MMKLFALLFLTLFAVSQAAFDCNSYCTDIMANCPAPHAQYLSMANCMAMCPVWPLGIENDTTGNSLACRAYHAGAAASLGTDHCYHAGPYGANLANNATQCGTQCEAYCSIMTYNSTTSGGCSASLRAFNSMAECMAICPHFPSDISKYYENATGNTLQCRIYHAKVAFSAGMTSLTTHCQHAAPLGGGQCGPVVDNYCSILSSVCTGAQDQFPGAPAGYCAGIAKYIPYNLSDSYNDYAGDTLACRAYHAVVGGAGGANAFHCAHGGISGNGTGACGTSVCDAFCALSAKVCPMNFANTAACNTSCTTFATGARLGAVPDKSGDTFYCRLYHLGAAATDPTTHCPHALATSSTCGGAATTPAPATTADGVLLGFSVLALIANLF